MQQQGCRPAHAGELGCMHQHPCQLTQPRQETQQSCRQNCHLRMIGIHAPEGQAMSATSAAARPDCFRVAQIYSTPLASASLRTSSTATPHFAAKPVKAFVGPPLASYAACARMQGAAARSAMTAITVHPIPNEPCSLWPPLVFSNAQVRNSQPRSSRSSRVDAAHLGRRPPDVLLHVRLARRQIRHQQGQAARRALHAYRPVLQQQPLQQRGHGLPAHSSKYQ